jgi:cytochrome c biogenesis protein CcmG, thiol:disulfide interchange protein DsbE
MDNQLEILDETQSPQTRHGLSLGSIVLLLGIAAVAGAFALALARQSATQPTSGPAPDFTLATFDGQPVHLADYRGKVVVLNFWASWCGPCREEAPVLESIWENYKDRGVVVLGVAYVDTDANSKAYMSEFYISYPNGPDLETRISEAFHIQGVPETFVIDQRGQIAEFIYAGVQKDKLMATLDGLLKDSATQ